MKDSILMAIESLCDDVARDTSAEDNRKRAEAIAVLAASGLILPDDERHNERKETDGRRDPTDDVPKEKHGTWIQINERLGICSLCGVPQSTNGFDKTGTAAILRAAYKHCPNCGAVMDGRTEKKTFEKEDIGG